MNHFVSYQSSLWDREHLFAACHRFKVEKHSGLRMADSLGSSRASAVQHNVRFDPFLFLTCQVFGTFQVTSLVRQRLVQFGDKTKSLDQDEGESGSRKNASPSRSKSSFGMGGGSFSKAVKHLINTELFVEETESKGHHHGSLGSGPRPQIPPRQNFKSISVHQRKSFTHFYSCVRIKKKGIAFMQTL